MIDFFDTSVLVSSLIEAHPHYTRARAAMLRSEADSAFIGVHSLAETFNSLTGLPIRPRVEPKEAVDLIRRDILPRFKIVTLDGGDYAEVLQSLAARNIAGAQIYDALLLQCAMKCGADRVFTFNFRHFQNLAPAGLTNRIVVP